ncbi:GlxA family transcriptional regulator [Phaeobacter sp. B1627]|uniref:GlxA family transcriptional regulator n=1 Tax=Phaeobacter sp. B1627 TaxID=2583809 RepID=UPI001117E6E9|nr:helix-turn-helix domain-containing protein [Phaeobacter sp. B1627]TNJ45082.1 helix-turn-helix domain-containing protein [Phaeobacter sp. B1627]
MQKWTNDLASTQQVDVLLFGDFSAHCLANTVEPLRAANTLARREIYRWRFLSLEGGTAVSSSGMEVTAHARLGECRGDMLVVMPSYHFLRHDHAETRRSLRAAATRYGEISGFDTGPWLLAAAGLLDGRQATIHWDEFDRMAEAFPEVRMVRSRYVQDGNRITCTGALAAFDLMLERIGRTHGQALRLEVAALFMSADSSGSGPETALARTRVVARAVDLMQAHLEAPLPIPEIARRIGRPRKDLEARMKADLGATPATVYRRFRLILARKLLLETDISVSEVALRTGYEDPSALTRAFRAEFKTTPRDLRRQHMQA